MQRSPTIYVIIRVVYPTSRSGVAVIHGTGADRLWGADITYVATWRGPVYVAFVIDVFSRMIVGWRVWYSPKSHLVLDGLEQALSSRSDADGLIHRSDRGSQYLSFRYTERLSEAGIESPIGSVGDSCDNALAESIIGLFKIKMIWSRGPTLNEVEYATLRGSTVTTTYKESPVYQGRLILLSGPGKRGCRMLTCNGHFTLLPKSFNLG
jgi:transposase InsO family protein